MGETGLLVLLIIAAVGWGLNRLRVLALCYYMTIKKYPPPTEEEMRASIEFVLRRIF